MIEEMERFPIQETNNIYHRLGDVTQEFPAWVDHYMVPKDNLNEAEKEYLEELK